MENIKKSDRLGVLLTRAQPFTKAHRGLVEYMLERHENVCVVIGSADKLGTWRNPFPINLRLHMVELSLREYMEVSATNNKHRVTIFGLNDWENEDNQNTLYQWGSYLYYNIVSRTQCKELTFYYSDGEETLQKWFPPEIKEHIEYVLNDRAKEFNGISATKIREAILNDNFEFVSNNIAKRCDGYYSTLREYLVNIDREASL